MNAPLYEAFSRYRRPIDLSGCPCCVEPHDQALLLSAPLAKLSADAIGHYAFKAMTTWGDAPAYLHFLPRILELSMTSPRQEWPGLEPWLVMDKMKMAGWPSALPHEVCSAVCEYACAATLSLLDVDAPEVDPRLHMLTWLGGDVAMVLRAWERREDLPALLRLAELIGDNDGSLMRDRQVEWSTEVPPHPVDAWLLAPARLAILEAAFFRTSGHDAQVLSRAVEVLTWCASAR